MAPSPKQSSSIKLPLDLPPENFRRQLRHEAEQWWQEGLISVDLYEQLAQRYQFQALEREASHRFIAILMGLGGILLGLAVITFVAANWQVWSRPVKVVLLLSLFLGINAAGFYLWRRPIGQKGQQRLGQGLLLLGALLLGANLALMSQMFHQSGNLYELFLIWSLGVVAMAYSLRLISLAILAWLLMAIGYWTAWITRLQQVDFPDQFLIQHLPLLAAGLYVPLAYRCRSKILFALSGVAVAVTLTFNLLPLIWTGVNGWLIAVAVTLPPLLLWSYSSQIWRSSRTPDPFQATARSLALWYMSLLYTVLAFRVWWEQPWSASSVQSGNVQVLLDALVFAVIAGLGWMQLRHGWYQSRHLDRALHSGTIAGFNLVTALALIWHCEMSPLGWTGLIVLNLLLFLLAIGLIRDGLALGSRDAFWGGMTLLVFGIICRMLEYNTGLLLKSVVFALCGLGVIAAGLWFERNIKLASALPAQEKSP